MSESYNNGFRDGQKLAMDVSVANRSVELALAERNYANEILTAGHLSVNGPYSRDRHKEYMEGWITAIRKVLLSD